MLSIAIELRADCPACGNSIPINSPGERFVCPSCSQELTISAEGWRILLGEPLSKIDQLSAGVPHTRDLMVGAPFHLTYAAQFLQCPYCKAALAEAAIGSRAPLRCSQCNQTIPSQAAPPGVAALGVTSVVGGGSVQGGGNAASRTVPTTMYCPECGSTIPLAGSLRTLKCAYCAADVVIPDNLWQRLHGVFEVQRWFVCLDGRASRDSRSTGQLSSLNDGISCVALDRTRNAAVLAAPHGSEKTLWCLGPDLTVRWTRPLDSEADRVAFNRDGQILVWAGTNTASSVYSLTDGAASGTVPRADIPGPYYAAKEGRSGALHGSWDGSEFRVRKVSYSKGDVQLASRSGVYSDVPIPFEDVLATGCDALGRLYVLGTQGKYEKHVELMRLTPDGYRLDSIATSADQGGTLGNEGRLAVAADGTIYLYGYSGLCILGADGRLLFRTTGNG